MTLVTQPLLSYGTDVSFGNNENDTGAFCTLMFPLVVEDEGADCVPFACGGHGKHVCIDRSDTHVQSERLGGPGIVVYGLAELDGWVGGRGIGGIWLGGELEDAGTEIACDTVPFTTNTELMPGTGAGVAMSKGATADPAADEEAAPAGF